MARRGSARVERIPAQRHARILEILRKDGVVAVQHLADALGASLSTVRRDLDHLTSQGYIDRHHGGAVMRREPSTRFEPEVSISARLAVAEKEAIGALAASRAVDGQSVILDSGSTVTAVARHLKARGTRLTAVTNDLTTAHVLADAPRIQTIVTGGSLIMGRWTLIGPPGTDFLSGITADIAFVGAHSIDESGMSETSVDVAAMKRLMISRARRVIAVLDSGKFAPATFCRVAPVSAIHELITDAAAPAEEISALEAAGVTCTRVEVAKT